MNLVVTVSAALFAGVLSTASMAADDGKGVITVPDNEDLKWAPAPANLPKGMQLVVLFGDPSKPGPFTLRVMMPPGTVIAPHTHKTDENLTVVSGNFYHAHGEKVDKSQGTEVHTGGFVYLPAKHSHYRLDDDRTGCFASDRYWAFRGRLYQPRRRPQQEELSRRYVCSRTVHL